jgi:hypothetical protein
MCGALGRVTVGRVLLAQCAAVFAAAFADAAVPVLPGEVVVVGLAAGATGPGASSAVVGSAAAGSLAGQLGVFTLVRRAVRRRSAAATPPAPRRPGRARSPVGTVVVAAFAPAGRLGTATAAAIAGQPVRRFLPLAASAALLGSLWLAGVGQLVDHALGGRGALLVTAVAAVLALVGAAPAVVRRARTRRGYRTTTERSTSPRSILWNASSTSSSAIVSDTKRSRSSLPCR